MTYCPLCGSPPFPDDDALAQHLMLAHNVKLHGRDSVGHIRIETLPVYTHRTQ